MQYETTVPTVSDRIAQTVVQRYLEPILEPVFHNDSYGYRPGRSAHDALAVARQRCWRHDWVLDLDVKSFFDEIDWELLMRAVRHHTDCAWVLLYIESWLRAPVCMPNGTLENREKGSPQGSVVSPILANLFLHYSFDMWMQRQFRAMNHSGKMFVSFIPAVSAKATKAMHSVLRQWKFPHRGDLALEELVRWLLPIVRGWVSYYGRFNPAALHQALRMVDELLVRWARRKYKGFKKRPMGAWDWLKRLKSRQPTLLPHWRLGPAVGR